MHWDGSLAGTSAAAQLCIERYQPATHSSDTPVSGMGHGSVVLDSSSKIQVELELQKAVSRSLS